MRYISEDGKVFNTEYECLNHENEVKEEEAKKAKLAQEKETRYNEVIKKRKEANEAEIAYLKEFCGIDVGELGGLLDAFGIIDIGIPSTLFRK